VYIYNQNIAEAPNYIGLGKIIFKLLFVVIFSAHAYGHSGGKDSLGCHNDTKQNSYHCHNSSYQPPVKKSNSSICHVMGSTYYSRTRNFTPFKTLEECIKSGGRLPKR
tara:strand:- start:72 stop:395 length:324 start_codon:yes stop_codon:yes gene_type:complete